MTPFRPRLARIVSVVLAIALIIGTGALFAVSPSFGMYEFTTWDYVGTIVFVALLLGLLWIQYQVRLVPSEDGIYIKNLFLSHRLTWNEIIGVDFGQGPWARIDTVMGDTINIMAIQSADGEYAKREAVRLATLIDNHSPQEPPTPA
ncbi:PH domain-containing protein [Flaviflexus massiliensis]|uniref:PH domain-containing protein n=1 Tax=Flaviflexus massiliensis TaxID=1522309 RepID=UPI0006D56DC6|nr:PH domain-containing protein [Flaviflexus massiliensis]